jgi:hypothetical protein
MPKVSHAGEDHGQTRIVRSRDHFIVADRSARLDHRSGARLDGRQQAVGEWEEGVRSHRRTDRARFGPAMGFGGLASLDCARSLPNRAGSSDPHRCRQLRRPWHRRWHWIDVLGHRPGKQAILSSCALGSRLVTTFSMSAVQDAIVAVLNQHSAGDDRPTV